jgi:hypothetical protein
MLIEDSFFKKIPVALGLDENKIMRDHFADGLLLTIELDFSEDSQGE